MARTPAPVAPPASRMVPRFAIRPANSYLPGIAVVELRMGNWTPSIVPQGDDQNVYLVVDDLGHLGQIWREAGVEMTDRESVINDLLEGQYRYPVRVIAFNVAEGWCRDASKDIARELRRRCDLRLTELSDSLHDFVTRFEETS
jgi:hypothetical protein